MIRVGQDQEETVLKDIIDALAEAWRALTGERKPAYQPVPVRADRFPRRPK